MAQGMTDNNGHVSPEFVEAVLDGHALGDPLSQVISTIAFLPGNVSPSVLHSNSLPRFCIGSKTVLTYTNFFDPSKANIRGKTLTLVFPRVRPFLMPSLVNPFLSLSLILLSLA